MSGVELDPAVLANALLAEGFYISVGATKGASVGHLFDNNRTTVHRDEKVITFADIEQFSRFGGDDDPSQIVDFPGDATVHLTNPPGGSSLHCLCPSRLADRENQ